MDFIDYKNLSPIRTNEFPCTGAHYITDYDGKEICYALRVGIVKTENIRDMLVKVPLSITQKKEAKKLIQEFNNRYPVSVKFENIQVFRYDINRKIVYSATAESFIIQED